VCLPWTCRGLPLRSLLKLACSFLDVFFVLILPMLGQLLIFNFFGIPFFEDLVYIMTFLSL
jgi:hypothetical protein